MNSSRAASQTKTSGMTLVEVLLAIFLVAIILMTLLRSQLQLANANSNAQVQITQATVAEAAAYRFRDTLTAGMGTGNRQAATDFPALKNELTGVQRDILDQLSYSASGADGKILIQVWMSNDPAEARNTDDPRYLEIEIPR